MCFIKYLSSLGGRARALCVRVGEGDDVDSGNDLYTCSHVVVVPRWAAGVSAPLPRLASVDPFALASIELL